MSRTHTLGLSFVAMLVAGSPFVAAPGAWAQERLFRGVDAVAGKQVRLGMAGNVSTDCKPGPLPEVKVLAAPKHGTLAVRDGKTKSGSLARCPSLEVPARGVFYQAGAKYSGADEVSYEVKRPDGRVQVHTVKITVGATEKPAAGKPAADGADL